MKELPKSIREKEPAQEVKATAQVFSRIQDVNKKNFPTQQESEAQAVEVLRGIRQMGEGKELLNESEYIRVAKETVKEVDYKVLGDIFDELRRKSGVDNPSLLVGPEKIQVDEKLDSAGAFHHERGAISLKPLFKGEASECTKRNFKNSLLGTLIHEETHAAAKNTPPSFLKMIKGIFSQNAIVIGTTGYEKKLQKGLSETRRFTFINEAVTDKIAEGVYTEYLRRTGDARKYADNGHPEYLASYKRSGAVMTVFVEVIAKVAHMPPDKVWESLIHGYMNGLDLDQTELKEALDEIFPGFIEKMGMIEQKTGLGHHAESLELPHQAMLKKANEAALTPEAKKRIMAAYEKFGYHKKPIL